MYLDLRNAMINRFRENPARKLSFTEARRGLAGDAAALQDLWSFLNKWVREASAWKPAAEAAPARVFRC